MSRRRRDILTWDWWKPPTFRTESVPVIDGVATLPDGRTIESGSQWIVYPVASGQEPITRRDLQRLRSWRGWRRFFPSGRAVFR